MPTLKDVIVHIPVDRPAEPVVDCALAVAEVFGSHLTGVVGAYQAINPDIVVGPTAANFSLPTEYNTDPQQANNRLDQFLNAAKQAGVASKTGCVTDSPFLANRTLGQISRLYDLSIVAQPDSERPTHDGSLPEAVLFSSGAPMLMVPYIHSGPLKMERVLICWNGGRQSARAVHDSLPFLQRAKAIDVVTINGSEMAGSETSPTALLAHLARHDLSATFRPGTAAAADVHNAILSIAADNGSDLLVMGGYGHSRFREFILGGVTRGMFESLTIPALMSH
jgi:nucleotide-binding universal stress UspA family protein